jgi:catechol 2,3-dioxygenase-like lactoylglutathione lyase family enzyme
VTAILDHIAIGVSDLAASKAFYEQALTPLGIVLVLEFPGAVGLGRDRKPEFWLRPGGGAERVHVAFRSPDRATVDAFYAAALAAGGTDNGAPGVREIYHPGYYGAFVLDPDGHNVEAVCHDPNG